MAKSTLDTMMIRTYQSELGISQIGIIPELVRCCKRHINTLLNGFILGSIILQNNRSVFPRLILHQAQIPDAGPQKERDCSRGERANHGGVTKGESETLPRQNTERYSLFR